MKNKSNTIIISKIVIIGIAFFFVLIFIKLFYVSLSKEVDNVNLQKFASNRNTKKQTLYANRGSIFDVNGETLAQNTNSYTVIAFLEEKRTTDLKNPRHVVDINSTAEALSPLLNMDKESLVKLMSQDLYQVELGPGGRNISELLKEQIEALDLPGISFTTSTKRWYKMGDFASYIIGYAKQNDKDEIKGELGIEEEFNKDLKGENGSTEYQSDIYGYKIANTPEKTTYSIAGNDIYLTIDNNIQIILENSIDKFENEYDYTWINFTVANAKTGAIVGSASSPSYDPNKLNISSYLTPLTQYSYEPGSTMKIFSFMAAMENGVYNPDELYESGTMKIGEYTIKDFNKVGFGTISYDVGFAYSSNIAAANLAKKLGKSKLRDFYEKLGFGSKTGIELPDEYEGKINFKYDIETANASFGQGITTTPVQTIQALTTLTNDGDMLKPYIVDKIVNPETKEVIYEAKVNKTKDVVSKPTIKKMQELMNLVVYGGYTSASMYAPSNITIAGKTGTAQIGDAENGGYLTGAYNYIKSFAGYFPYEDPEYIIYVSVKQLQQTAYSPLPTLVRSVVEDISKTKSITETENVNSSEKMTTITNYISKKTDVLELDDKLNTILLGNGDYVINQYPNNKTKVNNGTKLFLLTNGNTFEMPNTKGWSSSEIFNFCKLIGLKYTFEGYGYVESTSIEPNSIIDINAELEIVLKPKGEISQEEKKNDDNGQ